MWVIVFDVTINEIVGYFRSICILVPPDVMRTLIFFGGSSGSDGALGACMKKLRIFFNMMFISIFILYVR